MPSRTHSDNQIATAARRDPELPWHDQDWVITHRFIEKTVYDAETQCLLWVGCRDSKGYGQFGYEGRTRRAHVLSWEWANQQPLPRGMQVHHIQTCGRKNCITIGHLQLVTPAEHFAIHYAPTCKHGHERSEENTYTYRHRDGFERRACIPCVRAWQRAHASEIAARRRERRRSA